MIRICLPAIIQNRDECCIDATHSSRTYYRCVQQARLLHRCVSKKYIEPWRSRARATARRIGYANPCCRRLVGMPAVTVGVRPTARPVTISPRVSRILSATSSTSSPCNSPSYQRGGKLTDDRQDRGGVPRPLRRQRFDRHRAMQLVIVRERHDAHVATTDLALDRARSGDGTRLRACSAIVRISPGKRVRRTE